MVKILDRLENGRGRTEDLDLVVNLSDRMQGNTLCPLADALAMPARSYVNKFRNEFEAHVGKKACPVSGAAAG